VRWRRIAAVVALVAVVLTATATASARTAPPHLYTVAATEACMRGLPGAIAGLPPATPPGKAVVFVYSTPPSHPWPRLRGQLGAWSGQRRTRPYGQVTISFFKSVQAARAFPRMGGGSLVRNVVITWEHPKHPMLSRSGWRKAVRDCVGARPPAGGVAAPRLAVPRAGLATFAGYWGGHTRGLSITSSGLGDERADSGCCVREYRMTFQILSVAGSLTRASATYRVTSFKRYDSAVPNLRVGRVGKLLLRNGIITNSLTEDYFCSDPAWTATGACGA
jgi:hypothetical protein